MSSQGVRVEFPKEEEPSEFDLVEESFKQFIKRVEIVKDRLSIIMSILGSET